MPRNRTQLHQRHRITRRRRNDRHARIVPAGERCKRGSSHLPYSFVERIGDFLNQRGKLSWHDDGCRDNFEPGDELPILQDVVVTRNAQPYPSTYWGIVVESICGAENLGSFLLTADDAAACKYVVGLEHTFMCARRLAGQLPSAAPPNALRTPHRRGPVAPALAGTFRWGLLSRRLGTVGCAAALALTGVLALAGVFVFVERGRQLAQG